ncbi:MAG TPA: DsbA family protein [Allosphingosinicella sp.]|uniref:DsbA family protein n=1 Tax=Allosphingosinicella sp. TaxID=2823234 RepID=UPI002ED9C87A
MKVSRTAFLAGLGGLLIGGSVVLLAGPSLTGGVSGGERARVEAIVREYILEHPEIIPEAVQRLQDREAAAVVDQNRTAIETPFGSAWAGAENGDVVLVEFFDYACGFCRKSNEDIDRLLAEDKNLKVVWRELPVLGQDSVAAAQASLVAAAQGKFRPFYQKLFEAGRPTPVAVASVQNSLGIVSPAARAPEHRAEIQKNYQLADALKGTGTPLFVVGDKVLHGAVGYEALKTAIAEARKRS